MLNTILGSKLKMSQTFIGSTRVPITLIKAGPCVVTQIKKLEKDGYWAVQLGFGQKKNKNISKALLGHLKGALESQKKEFKNQNKAPRFLREVRLEREPEFKVGDVLNVADIFKKSDVIQVTGISKGKGFSGVVKRWGFSGGPRTHGQSDRERAPGSIGQGTTPGRIWKGKKMAGRAGNRRVTVKNLMVVSVDPEKNLMSVSGPVPGAPGQLLIIKKIAEGKLEELEEKTPPPEVKQEQESEAGVNADSEKKEEVAEEVK